ncbi:unnamed protein product [Mytilus edulis]|uniref:Protein NO VEIN C-terminal domain-containing protein n=1 Tax=Mytilus edulis TaxID=6550 RepID=A0A8S3QME2_MYTED|nr:unnamed protein product [Mytilus edulis]
MPGVPTETEKKRKAQKKSFIKYWQNPLGYGPFRKPRWQDIYLSKSTCITSRQQTFLQQNAGKYVAPGNRPNYSRKPVQAPVLLPVNPFSMPAPLTQAVNKKSNTLDEGGWPVLGTSAPPKTRKQQETKSTNESSHKSGPAYHVNAQSSQVLSHPHSVNKNKHSHVEYDDDDDDYDTESIELLVITNHQKMITQQTEGQISTVTHQHQFYRIGQISMLETCAQECIELLAESNNYVSQERIQKLLLQRCNIQSLQEVGLRRIEELSCVKEHNRAIAKVNAYVQAFLKVRSICTLHELKYCLRECDPEKTDFNNLNLGPMQRLPIIYEYFKFPTDMEEIPAITTVDILEHLRNYLTQNMKWSEKVDLTQFMEYLVPQYEADNAYQLGIRISSVALAIQVLKMAQRHASENRRNVIETFKGHLHDDIEKAFQKFRMTVIHTSSDGSWEVRNRYMTLGPEVAIQEIFEKFKFLMLMEEPSGRSQIKMHQKIESSILNFLQILRADDNASALFHLAICVSHSVLQEAAMKRLLPKEEDEKTEAEGEERVKPPKLLEEYGGTSLGSGSGSSDSESGFKPCNGDILSFIHQCTQCGLDSEEDIDAALCNQFNVKETRQLGYGKITNLMTASKKPGQHQYQEHSLVFEVAMGTEVRIKTESKIGLLGHQTKEAALACLHNCPLLEDMEIWSHWSLVFEPELGKLKDFIQKYGGTNTIQVDGGKRSFTYHIIAMETALGVLLKLTSQTSTELFEEALMQKNPRNEHRHQTNHTDEAVQFVLMMSGYFACKTCVISQSGYEIKSDEEIPSELFINPCERVVNTIRKEEFGIGIELNEDGQKLKIVQDERLGRSLTVYQKICTVENSSQVMRRKDLGNDVIEIEHNTGIDRWLVVKKMLDASKISLQNHKEFTEMKALINFLQFVPVEGEILDFFRPVSTQILKQLRAKPCLPTQPYNGGDVLWRLPTQVVCVKDSLVHEVVTPEFLQKHLDLFYLHREVADMLNPTLIQCLGIESLTVNHLIQIGKAITFHLSMKMNNKLFVDPISYLQEDMKTIHPLFLAAPDSEVNSQVQKMLHKNRETLISYLVYIKEQTEKNSSLVNMDELATVAIVMTNQGEKYPKKDNVYFTPIYGNKYNLMQIFPGYDWCLLGITDFITVRPVQVELDSKSVKESAWSSIEQLYPDDFRQGCVIEDYSCDEIRDLLKSNKCPQSYKLQMKSLCEYLDQVWDTQFVRYTKTKLIRKDNKQERDVESSFCIWLKTCDWLPAIEVKAGVENNGAIKYTEEVCCKKPSTLYYPFEKIVKLLHYTVNYVSGPFDTNKSTFAQFLGLKFEVSLEDLISSLKKWGQRSDGGIPALFATSQSHIEHLYSYLGENLNKKQIQDLLDKAPVIFVPVITKSVGRGDMNQQRFAVNVAGQMLSRQEVWWEDKTELFQKHQDILTEIHADIGRKKILSRYINYSRSPSLREFFMMGKIQTCPDVEEYSELLVHVASSQSRVETETLHDVMKLLSMIGDLMYVDENDPESVTKKMLNEIQRKKMLNHFKGQNIIPTKRKTWTSLEKNPLIADNNEYEHIFKDDSNVHFVLMEENEHRRGQHNVRASVRESYHINSEAMMSVLRMCEIENLSDVVEEQIIPSGDLLTDIHSCIFEKTNMLLEDCLSRHSDTDIDETEVVWTVPESLLTDIEPVVEEEEDDVEEEEITASTNEPAIMRAWPPMSDGKNHPKAKSTVDRDEQAESKVWPPPRAPDYMKTVKDLPSGVRVVRESQEGDQRTSQNTTDKLPVADIIKSGEEEHPSEDQHQERPKETVDEDKSVPPKSVSDGIPAVAQHDDRPPSSNHGDRPPSSNHGDRPPSSHHDDGPTIIHHDGKPHLNHHEQHDNHSSTTLRNKVPVDAQTELEYEVEELASGKTLKLPNFTMSDEETPEMAEIGQYGEQIVYNYLLNEKENNPNISSVKWCNEEEEIGLPYDFTVGLKTEKEEYTVYIEVKSTISDTKEIFEISYPQVKFAQNNRERFHVYRIFSSLNPDRVRLVRIQNLAQKINAKQVKLCLLI